MALRRLPERNRFFKGLASWIGFRQMRVDYEPAERAHGATTSDMELAARPVDRGADVVLGRAAAARQPARAAAGVRRVGVRRQILFESAGLRRAVPGYPSVMVGLMVLGGVQLVMIGVVGEYIGKILSEIKGAAGLFRRRAQREDGRERDGRRARPPNSARLAE